MAKWRDYPTSKIEEYSEIQSDDTNNNYVEITSVDNKTVPIPKGFAYGVNDSVGKVQDGLVITDSVEKKGDKIYSNGNEFVWIPINDLKVEGTNKYIAIKESNESDNYKGVLYTFSGTSSEAMGENAGYTSYVAATRWSLCIK